MDILLRLGGLLLIILAGAAVYRLIHLVRVGTGVHGTAFDYLLAMIGFGCASGGSAMLGLGGHLFDEVEVSERWRPRH